LSLKLTGSMMFAVRFPCVILGGLTAWAVYRLAVMTTRSHRIGLIAVLLLPVIPKS
jgi:4-amino-4-deoxy-L-arabinose transferase-like glycosyltransferase